MSNAGRPATPLELKLLAGNPGKRNLSAVQDETPQYAKITPDMDIDAPDWMNDTAKHYYCEIAQKMACMNVLTQMDNLALELLVTKYQHYRECYEYIETNGFTYEIVDKEGNVKSTAYPEVAIMDAAFTRVVSILVQFGWTPASRTKVKLNVKTADPVKDMMKRTGK